MISTHRLRQSAKLFLAAACAVLALASLPPLLSQSEDTATEASQPADAPQRPTLPEDAAVRVTEHEGHIEEFKKAGGDDDLAEAIALAEEVLAIRLEHQGPKVGWNEVEGEPAEWWEVGDARRAVEDLKLRASLSLESRAELAEAKEADSKVEELYGQGKFSDALDLTRFGQEIYRRVLGDDHPQTLTMISNTSVLLSSQGRYAEAEPYSRESLEGLRRVAGDDHPRTLTSLHGMGFLLDAQCRYAEAEPYYREALEGSRRVRGDDHTSTLILINNMGMLLNAQGRYAEAEPYVRESLEGSRRVLGHDHPTTLIATTSMGTFLRDQGRYAEAEPYYRESLKNHRRILGDDHPNTLISINNMGTFLMSQGRYAEAEPYTREAQEGNRRVLGDDHPDTLNSLNNMGFVLCSQGLFAEAEQHWLEALEGNRRVLGDDHTQTLRSINHMGGLFMDQGLYAEAEPYYGEVLKALRRTMGDDHLYTLIAIGKMGHLLECQGRFADSEPYYREALEGSRRVLGDEHPETAASFNRMAGLLYNRGDYTAAESMWAEAAHCFEEVRLLVSIKGLGRVHHAAHESPLAPFAACLARNGKPLPAWQRLESNLARGLLDTMSAREARPLNTNERDREQDLIGQLSKLDERISASLEAKQETEESRARARQLRNEREKLQSELATFLREMSDKYGVAAGEVYTLSLVQTRLPDDSALLAWVDIKGDPNAADPNGDHWACLVKKVGDPICVKLPGSGKDGTWTEADDELAHQLRQKLGHWAAGPSVQWRQELVRKLHAQRIAPIEPHLDGIRHLIVLPAGMMAGVPVEVLTDDFTVSYAPSGTMYTWLREKTTQKWPTVEDSGFLLALGDPVFQTPSKPEKPLHEPPAHGVLVAMVAPESNALRSGLETGDVLLTYGGAELGGPDDLGPAIQKAQEQTPESVDGLRSTSEIPVSVWREGKTLELAVAPGRLGVRPAQQPVPEAILTQRRLDGLMTSTRSSSFNPIPHTRQEVEVLADLFKSDSEVAETDTPKGNTLILLGSEASEQRLDGLAEAGELRKYRYLHLATHGVMDDKIAMNSAMILSQDNLPDAFEQAVAGEEIYDGRLTAEQIVRTWKLDADLVTLSGCETALGEESGGEGFLGFSQALFVAGARSLLLSLWKVDDRATMLLMRRFYENMLGKYEDTRSISDREFESGTPMPKAEALREAKIWLRQLTADQVKELDTHYRGQSVSDVSLRPEDEATSAGLHPYEDPQYWASFILIGDPD